MNTYTDDQLKKALAKLLPDVVTYDEPFNRLHFIISAKGHVGWPAIKDTELLHLCWMVEETLDSFQKCYYGDFLYGNTKGESLSLAHFEMIHASWQQRVIALCKVKGVEIV